MLLAYGRFLFKYRNALFPVLFLSLALFFPPTAAFGSAMADRLLDLVGFAVLLAGLAMRLHSLIGDVESYSLRSSAQRVIGYLLQHCPHDGECEERLEFTLPTSKQVIASRLNLTPETLSRIFHDLAEGGLIEVHGRQIMVPDLARLRAYDL